jgi:hypothetical protein
MAEVVAEIVLVIFADEADIGKAGGLDDKTHRLDCER